MNWNKSNRNELDRAEFYLSVIRGVVGGGLFFYGTWLLHVSQRDAEPHLLLVGLACLIVAGKLLAPFIAAQLSRPAGLIYSPGVYLNKPPPTYSRAHGHRAFRRYEDAMLALWEILAEHPQELEAWSELIELALIDLADPARAREIFLEARRSLVSPEKRSQLEDVWTMLGARAALLGIQEGQSGVATPLEPKRSQNVLSSPPALAELPSGHTPLAPIVHEAVLELPVLEPLPGKTPPEP